MREPLKMRARSSFFWFGSRSRKKLEGLAAAEESYETAFAFLRSSEDAALTSIRGREEIWLFLSIESFEKAYSCIHASAELNGPGGERLRGDSLLQLVMAIKTDANAQAELKTSLEAILDETKQTILADRNHDNRNTGLCTFASALALIGRIDQAVETLAEIDSAGDERLVGGILAYRHASAMLDVSQGASRKAQRKKRSSLPERLCHCSKSNTSSIGN